MTSPNFGLLAAGNGFQNALSQGYQLGTDARVRREETEKKNALAEYAAKPDDPKSVSALIKADPRLGVQVMEKQRERQAEVELGKLTQRALGGDKDAMGELAVKNFDRWKSLDDNQRAATKAKAEVLGGAAMDVLNRPPEQRQAAVLAYAQQLGQQYPGLAELTQLPPDQLEAALRGAVAEAGMVGKMIEMERPDYMAVPYDATLVNTRDPASLQQFGQGAPQGNVPPPPPGFQIDGGQTASPSAAFSGSFRPAGVNPDGVTSTYRTPERNREVGGVPNSYHTRRGVNGEPLAVDSVPPPGMSMSAYAAKLRKLNPGLDVINEGDHVHIEPRG